MTLSIPGLVRLETDPHGLSRFVITNEFAEAHLYLLGAQVTHFQPAGHDPLLWLSPLTAFQIGKAIRGGVPICWPWFGPHPTRGDLPAHGLARTREWRPLDAAQLADGRTRVRLVLSDDASTIAAWPHSFALILAATIGDSLELELAATNTGDGPFSYTDALHTYLRVGDLRTVRVRGLEDQPFIHSTRRHRGVQSGPIGFDGGEVNHIHVPSRGPVVVEDPSMGRRIDVAKGGSEATVVWNPGQPGGAAMIDIGEHWAGFVCVEAATCADARITLLPGTSHATRQVLTPSRTIV
jgi:glucose-6-phosphate 1-epimerase